MNNNYLRSSENLMKHGRCDYSLSSNIDEECIKFLPKLSSKQVYDLSSTYPTYSYKELSKKLKSIFGIKNLILTAGCEDLIIRICHTIKSNEYKTGVVFPTFYRITDNLRQFISINWKDIEKINYEKIDFVFIVNPNTLNGKTISKKVVLNLAKKYPNTIFAIDETSILFLDNWKEISLFSDVNKYTNIVVISSLSKFFGLSGHRIGFTSASIKLLKKLGLETTTFPISNLSAFIASEVVSNNSIIKFIRQKVDSNKTDLINRLSPSKKIGLLDTTGNCIYCYSKDGTKLHRKLITLGIIGLDLGCQKGVGKKGLVRLTVHGSEKKHKFLINKLKQII